MSVTVRIGTSSGLDTAGIHTFLLGDDGILAPRGVEPVRNPSYIIYNADRSRLYAALESGPAVAAYAVEGDGLRLLNTEPTGVPGPCHLYLHGGTVYAACFGGGLAALPLDGNGALLPAEALRYAGMPGAPAKASHTHQIRPLPGGAVLCAVDMGMDALFLHPAGNPLDPGTVRLIKTPEGSGPRHMVFSADGCFGYVCCELDNHVLAYAVRGEALKALQRIDALPQGYDGEKNYCGPIRLSPDGRRLLVGNRGQNCIAVFAIGADGLLSPPAWYDCGGNFPRDMAFTPDGRYFLAACQRGNTVSVLRYTAETGALTKVSDAPAPTPTCVLF